MYRHFNNIIAMILGLLIIAGCSSGRNPTQILSPSIESDFTSQSSHNTQMLWGFWDVTFDPATCEFQITPIRGAMFQANVTKFLQPPSTPIHFITINIDTGASDLPSGFVVCDVTLRHPFVGLAKWRGFDVMGIVMGDASYPGSDPGDLWPDLDELRVLNADGYTRWWNPTEFTTYNTIFGYTEGSLSQSGYFATGIINGFKYFADDLDADEPFCDLDLATRGTFSVDPGINSRCYEIQFPTPGGIPDFHFNYAITASYSAPLSDDDPEYPIDIYPISANMSEAFRIDITDAGSTAYYENATTYGGDLRLDIEVFDWGLADASTVEEEIVVLFYHSLMMGDGWWAIMTEYSEPGSTDYSQVFHLEWPNVIPTGVDDQEVFIRVLSANPHIHEPDIPGITGFDWPDTVPLSAYTIYEAEISSVGPQENHPPEVGVIDGPDYIFQDEDHIYTLSYATDIEDGTNLTILWDNDGDLDFDDDLDGDNTDLQCLLNFPTKGYQLVIARAVDSGGLWTDSEPFEVYVDYCPTEIHNNFSAYNLGDAPGGNFSRMDSAFQSVGEYAGWLLVQTNANEVRRYDVTQPSPWTGVPYIALDPYNNNDLIFSMDVCDHSGRIIISIMNKDEVLDPSLFDVYDLNGDYLTTLSVGAQSEVCAIDTDENGDLWLATWDNNAEIALFQHFEYLDEVPYYIEDPTDTCDITVQFPENNQMWDLAVSYTLDRIYALRGCHWVNPIYAEYGEIYSWDIGPDGSLTFNDTIQNIVVFPDMVFGAYPTHHGSLVDGKIDIDHASELSEKCRIVAMARSTSGGHSFAVLDSDLNIIDCKLITPNVRRYSFALGTDPSPANRPIFTSGYTSGEVHLSPAPPRLVTPLLQALYM